MIDLVIRLRSGCDRFAIDAGPRALLLEAADEIASLRAELSGARQQGETGQPVLTDAEREAVDECVRCAYPATHHAAATLRGLLDRLGGGE